jgi:hypothetical protein
MVWIRFYSESDKDQDPSSENRKTGIRQSIHKEEKISEDWWLSELELTHPRQHYSGNK